MLIEFVIVIEGEVSDVDDSEDEDKDGGLFRIFFLKSFNEGIFCWN